MGTREEALARYIGRQRGVESPNIFALVRDNGSANRPEVIFLAIDGDPGLQPGMCLYRKPGSTDVYGKADPLNSDKMPATVIIEERATSTVYIVRPLAHLQEMAMAGLSDGKWYYVGTDGKPAKSSDANFPTTGTRQAIGQAIGGVLRIQPGFGTSDPTGSIPQYFYNPWSNTAPETLLPSPNASDQDDEFNDAATFSTYSQLGTWTPGGLDRGGLALSAPPNEAFYSYDQRSSWLMVQPRAGSEATLGLHRAYGSTPTNWLLTSMMSIDISTATGVDGWTMFLMGQTAAGSDPGQLVNPFWPFDSENLLAIFTATIDGMPTFAFGKVEDGAMTTVGIAPVDARLRGYNKLRIHKAGTSYKGSVGNVAGDWLMLGNAVTFADILPNRYGWFFAGGQTPNVTIGIDWVRHREVATVAD